MSMLTNSLVSRWLNVLALISLVGQLFVPLAYADGLPDPFEMIHQVEHSPFLSPVPPPPPAAEATPIPFVAPAPANASPGGDLGQNLVGYWPLDEGEGIRYDSTAHNNHLQSLNNVGSAPGMLGASALFQPNQHHTLSLSHTLQSGLNITTSSTVVGWVKPSALGNHMTLVSKHINSDPSYRLNIKDSGVLNFLLNPNPDGSGIGILAGNSVLISDT